MDADKPNAPPWSLHPTYSGCLVNRAGVMVADCTDSAREDGESAALALVVLRAVNTVGALKDTLRGLIEAVELDSVEKGISGFTGARLSDARHVLQLAEVRTC